MSASLGLSLPGFRNVEAYLAALPRLTEARLLRGDVSLSPAGLRCVEKLLATGSVGLLRRAHTRGIVYAFCDDVIGGRPGLHFPFHLAENACMTDDGRLYFSLLFLYGSSAERTLKVILHEIAHWWLSRQGCYPAYLQLDRAYASARPGREAVGLSPIELFATLLAGEITASLSRQIQGKSGEKLRAMAQTEFQAINTAIHSLCL